MMVPICSGYIVFSVKKELLPMPTRIDLFNMLLMPISLHYTLKEIDLISFMSFGD